MSEHMIKDSGKRESFTSGAVRDTQEGKPRYDLIPVYAMSRLSQIYAQGRIKYPPEQKPGERLPIENWRRGIDTQRFMASLLRHAYAYLEGNRDEDHMAQLVFNALGIIETEEMVYRRILPPSLLTLPDWTKPEGNLQAPQDTPRQNSLSDDEVDLDKCGTIDGVTPIPATFYDGRWHAAGSTEFVHWEVRRGKVYFHTADREAVESRKTGDTARKLINDGLWVRCNEDGEALVQPEDK